MDTSKVFDTSIHYYKILCKIRLIYDITLIITHQLIWYLLQRRREIEILIIYNMKFHQFLVTIFCMLSPVLILGDHSDGQSKKFFILRMDPSYGFEYRFPLSRDLRLGNSQSSRVWFSYKLLFMKSIYSICHVDYFQFQCHLKSTHDILLKNYFWRPENGLSLISEWHHRQNWTKMMITLRELG